VLIVNCSLKFSTRGHLQRARSRLREPAGARVRVLRIAVRDHARVAAHAQNAANTGAFKAKPRELPRGASVNCAATFGWWWKKNGSRREIVRQGRGGRRAEKANARETAGFRGARR
jgi:hypothetical protein